MSLNSLSSILMIVIIVIVILLAILALIYFRSKNAKPKKEKNISVDDGTEAGVAKEKKAKTFAVESVMDFMEFDKVEDNMIVAKNGAKYIMVVECQGINYDLMSEIEKNAVEEGFVQFLNTIRYPIQIYVQSWAGCGGFCADGGTGSRPDEHGGDRSPVRFLHFSGGRRFFRPGDRGCVDGLWVCRFRRPRQKLSSRAGWRVSF